MAFILMEANLPLCQNILILILASQGALSQLSYVETFMTFLNENLALLLRLLVFSSPLVY